MSRYKSNAMPLNTYISKTQLVVCAFDKGKYWFWRRSMWYVVVQQKQFTMGEVWYCLVLRALLEGRTHDIGHKCSPFFWARGIIIKNDPTCWELVVQARCTSFLYNIHSCGQAWIYKMFNNKLSFYSSPSERSHVCPQKPLTPLCVQHFAICCCVLLL